VKTYWAAAAVWTLVGAVPAAAAGYALKPSTDTIIVAPSDRFLALLGDCTVVRLS
jgi:hypothetical protein